MDATTLIQRRVSSLPDLIRNADALARREAEPGHTFSYPHFCGSLRAMLELLVDEAAGTQAGGEVRRAFAEVFADPNVGAPPAAAYVPAEAARGLFTMLEEVAHATTAEQTPEERQAMAVEVHAALGQYERAVGAL